MAYDLTLIREIAEEMNLPIEIVRKAVFAQYEHYVKVIGEGEFETCRAHHLGKWRRDPYKVRRDEQKRLKEIQGRDTVD